MRSAIALGIVLLLTAYGFASFAKEPQRPPPVALVAGGDSKIEEPSIRRMTSAAELRKVWLEHHGTTNDSIHSPTFEVDMSRYEVVAIFLGKTVNSAGLHVRSVAADGDAVLVRFIDDGFQTSGTIDGGAKKTTPYAFVVLEKSEKLIRVERDVQNEIGRLPVWKEVARLPAISASTTQP